MKTETIIGNYRLEERIGSGGMGVVYRGRHLQLPRVVAIKSINASDHKDLRRLRPRFEKEAYIQSQLDHQGIVKIYDYIVDEQTYYIVMEYVEGRSLAHLLADEKGPLPLARALDIFEQVLTAIICAHTFVYRDTDGSSHRGLVHRDLKPANILITPDDRVKITDFGIVKLVGAENTDTLGSTYGSPDYVSPEQAVGEPLDQRSDIYSLGIILYEMLTNASPFGGEGISLSRTEILRAHVEQPPRPPSELNAELKPEIEAIIMRALEKERDKRYPDSTEFLRAVRRLRGRDTTDLEECDTSSPPQARSQVGTQEIKEPATMRSPRESYITQPIGSNTCASCGATSFPGDRACRQCGHELNASPATVRLTRQEAVESERKRARSLWLLSALLAVGGLGLAALYMARDGASTKNSATGSAATSPAPDSTPVPPGALAELKPARVSVDSNFDGYSAAPLTDGETNVQRIARMRYNTGNWASAETPTPHWIELTFDHPSRVSAVYIYWGFDRDRFMPSRRVELQAPDNGGDWRTVSAMQPGNDHDRMAFEFTPITTTRVRIFQPAQQGPANRPFVMWVREVTVFGVSGN
ncbi:MAG: protein kinase [Pyrinomonadaceae bacterium]